MITVLVTYKLPKGMDRPSPCVVGQAAPRFQVLEGLRMKHFRITKNRDLAEVSTWDTREAADTFHTEAWLNSVEERM